MNEADDVKMLLEAQRDAFRAEGIVTPQVRVDRLDRALDLLVTHEAEFCEAVAADFGQRSAVLTRFMDVLPSVLALKYSRRHVRRWMRPRCRRVGLPAGAPGVRAEIVPQPLGVVGVVSPWNFPLTLTFARCGNICGRQSMFDQAIRTHSASEFPLAAIGRQVLRPARNGRDHGGHGGRRAPPAASGSTTC